MKSVSRLHFSANISCALAVAACLLGAPAVADDATDRAADAQQSSATQDEAKRRFSRGLELYKETDYTAALVEFRKAYSLIPSYKLLFNIGQVCFQLQNYACALQAFEQYLAEGTSEVVGARRTSVEADIEKLRTRVGRVTVKTATAGVTIAIDDVIVGKTPLDSVMVSAGTRRVSAMIEGKPAAIRTISVAGEENAVVEFELGDSGRGRSDPNAPATSAAARTSSSGVPSWPFWVSTAGLAIGAGVTGYLATKANSDLDQQRATFGIEYRDLQNTERRASNLALASDILTGAAVVSGGIALYTTLASKRRPERTALASPSAAPSGVNLAIGVSSVSFSGHF